MACRSTDATPKSADALGREKRLEAEFLVAHPCEDAPARL